MARCLIPVIQWLTGFRSGGFANHSLGTGCTGTGHPKYAGASNSHLTQFRNANITDAPAVLFHLGAFTTAYRLFTNCSGYYQSPVLPEQNTMMLGGPAKGSAEHHVFNKVPNPGTAIRPPGYLIWARTAFIGFRQSTRAVLGAFFLKIVSRGCFYCPRSRANSS